MKYKKGERMYFNVYVAAGTGGFYFEGFGTINVAGGTGLYTVTDLNLLIGCSSSLVLSDSYIIRRYVEVL